MTDSSSHPEVRALERCLTMTADACSRLADENDRLLAENTRLRWELAELRVKSGPTLGLI